MGPGTRRFNGGVQGQQISLKGDIVDHLVDLGDLSAGSIDIAHRIDDFLHIAGTVTGRAVGFLRQLPGLPGVFGILGDLGADLRHRAGNFLQRGGLLRRPLRQRLAGIGNLLAAGADEILNPKFEIQNKFKILTFIF
jgi:hypothetical protein